MPEDPFVCTMCGSWYDASQPGYDLFGASVEVHEYFCPACVVENKRLRERFELEHKPKNRRLQKGTNVP